MKLSNKNYLVNIISSLWCIILNIGTSYCYSCTGTYYTSDVLRSTTIYNECIGDKVIPGSSYFCTFKPYSDYHRLGDYYYSSTSNVPGYSSIVACSNHICTCRYFFDIAICYGKKYYNCYNDGSFTNTYCNYETKECYSNNCPYEFTIRKINGLATGVTRCSDTCLTNEWHITIPNTDDNTITEYCVDSCYNPTSGIYSSYQYEYIYNGVRKCLESCIDEKYIKYLGSNKYACVSREECDYYANDDHKCYSLCSNHDSKNHHNYGSFECIEGCKIGEYKYENDNICYRKTDCNFVDEHSSPYKCLVSSSYCDHSTRYKYHDYNSKLCIDECGKNNEKYIFIANGGNICYSSCAEIPGYYRYEKIDETGVSVKTCYQTKPTSNCEVYYQKADGVFKCINKNDCINILKYKYIFEDECRMNCDDFYKIEYEDEETPTLKYIKCFDTLEAALSDSYNVKFCDKYQKKCWKNFPNDGDYYIKSLISSSYTERYEIIKDNSNYYYFKTGPSTDISANKNWYVNNCKTINKYFLFGSKKCLDSCKDVYKYYYNPINNECLNSCELLYDMQFSYKITDGNPESCLNSCDASRGKYYNYNSHFCLEHCNDDNSNNKISCYK